MAEKQTMAFEYGFRVICDVTEFFSDERSKLMIYVDLSKDHFIADLVARIKILLGLQSDANVSLLLKDCLLPETENVRILQQEDVLRVINKMLPLIECVEKNNFDLQKGKRKDRSEKKNKRKLEMVGYIPDENREGMNSSKTENDNNDVKSFPLPVTIPLTNGQGDHNLHMYGSVIEKDTSFKKVCFPSETIDTTDKPTSISSPENECTEKETKSRSKKRKRTRIRVRKRLKDDKTIVQNCADNNEVSIKTKPSLSYSAPTTTINGPSNSKHIRFSDNSDNESEISNSVKKVKTHVEIASSKILESEPCANNCSNVQLQPVATRCDTNQSITECISVSSVKRSGNVSDQEVIFGKLLALANYSAPLVIKRVKPCTPEEETDTVSTSTVPFQGLPKSGDILTFKILRLDENYCPQMSKRITAEVIEYSDTTNDVSLNILAGSDQCRQPSGKFDIESSENELEDEPPSVVKFKWSEILEPKQNVLVQ